MLYWTSGTYDDFSYTLVLQKHRHQAVFGICATWKHEDATGGCFSSPDEIRKGVTAMMSTGSFFPWPILIVPAAMFLTMVFLMAQRFRSSQDSARLGCGHNTYRQFDRPPAQKAPSQDPILILRERYARGEITTEEFKQQVDEFYALSTLRQFPGGASDPRQ